MLDDNNINNNNHAALAERFQPSTLHKLRQLDRFTNTDTPYTAQKLDAEAVPAEVDYTRTNTQLSCSRGGESDRVPNIFKEGMAGQRHHRDGGQRYDHFQSGTTGADHTAHDGGRARGGGSDNEGGGGILLQHDVGVGLR